MSTLDRKIETYEFAARMIAMGFRVFVAEQETYGYITNDTGSRVLCFSFSWDCSLSGAYGPPTTTSGTGWRMDETPDMLRTKEDVNAALYATPPLWCRGGWKHLSTEAQYRAQYQSSSRFKQIGA